MICNNSEQGNVYVGFGKDFNGLEVKCIVTFIKPTKVFNFSLNTEFTVDRIQTDVECKWETVKEWQPQWQHKSKVISVSSDEPFCVLTIEYSFRGRILSWCNIIEENRIALSSYSAWSIFETSVPIKFLYFLENMEDYFVINARYDEASGSWVYGETDHEGGNITALKKGKYHTAVNDNFAFYYLDKNEKEYADSYVSNYDAIMEFLSSVFGKKEIKKMSVVSLGIESGGGAYIRKELMIIEKLDITEDKEKIRRNVIGLLGHELGHNWFKSADTESWEDWVGETGAEWAALLYILSLDEKDFFDSHIAWAKNNYASTPVIKSPDGKRPANGVHIRGVMIIYEIYLSRGIETVTSLLKILSEIKNPTTENFLAEVKNKMSGELSDKIELCLTAEEYTGLFD
ncbi:MAG: hypothetical protein FWE82_07780 [Defluviitaleaceae bacterium]|nr:hypothetical protein [Defluviitaleaceae bacterium]